MSDSSWKVELIEGSSGWLDVDAPAGALADETVYPMAVHEQRFVADLQLVDALLSSMSAGAAKEQAERVEKAVQTIQQFPIHVEAQRPSASPRRRLAWRRSAWAIAACLAIAFSVIWDRAARESRAVESVLRNISAASLESDDRVYAVSRSSGDSASENRHIGQLYLRGRDGFVLACDDAVLGRQNGEFWLVHRQGEVVVASDFDWIVGASQQQQRELALLKEISIASQRDPLVELSTTVELLRSEYDLALRSNRELAERAVDIVVGTLRRRNSDLPDVIQLWSERDSHIIQRAEFRWSATDDIVVILELVESPPLGDDWYRRERHQALGQPIRRVSQGD